MANSSRESEGDGTDFTRKLLAEVRAEEQDTFLEIFGTSDIRKALNELFESTDEWLDAPNEVFGGKKPRDLLDTKEEIKIREQMILALLGIPT